MKKFEIKKEVLMAIAPKSNGLLKKDEYYNDQVLHIQGIEEADGGDLDDGENDNNGRSSVIFKVNDGSLIRMPLGSFINQKIVGIGEDASESNSRVYNSVVESTKAKKTFTLPAQIKVIDVEPSVDFNGNKRYPATAYKVFQEALEERQNVDGFEFGQLFEDRALMSKCTGDSDELFSGSRPEHYKLLTLEMKL